MQSRQLFLFALRAAAVHELSGLLQGSRQVSHLVKISTAVSSAFGHFDQAAVVDRSISHFESNPNELTVAELQSLKDMVDTLTLQFETDLKLQSTRDQDSYNAKKLQHAACSTHKDKRLHTTSGDVSIKLAEVATARTKHKSCRKVEKSLARYHSVADTVSSAWDTMTGTSAPDDTNLCDLRTNFQDSLSAHELLGSPVVACSTDQSNFESDFCGWLDAKTSTCIAFDECIAAVGLSTFKNDIQTAMTNRDGVRHTIDKVQCRLLHLFDAFNGKNNSIADTCENTEAPSAEVLTLTIPNVTICSSDSDITNPTIPSSDSTSCAAWLTKEYPWGSTSATHAHVGTCVSHCTAQPTAIGTAAGAGAASGCTDSDESICAFYTRHWGACGLYADDNAVEKCCACGGGTTLCNDASDCNGHGTTVDADKSDGCACTCASSWTGADCSTPPPCTAASDCSGHGTTTDADNTNGCTCTCSDSWTGADCSTPPPCFAASDCSGHGTTTDADKSDGCTCTCSDSWTGADCSIAPTTCTCSIGVDNYLHDVYVDGVSFDGSSAITFLCDDSTVLAFSGSDHESGCAQGGAWVSCTSTDEASPWNGLNGLNSNWKSLGGGTRPADWYKTKFDDSSWKQALSGSSACQNAPSRTTCMCDAASKHWSFRWSR